MLRLTRNAAAAAVFKSRLNLNARGKSRSSRYRERQPPNPAMPPKPPPKGKPLSKKELLDLLCVTLEKLREKAEVTLERARQERSLDHMTDAEDTLDKAYERQRERARASERERDRERENDCCSMVISSDT